MKNGELFCKRREGYLSPGLAAASMVSSAILISYFGFYRNLIIDIIGLAANPFSNITNDLIRKATYKTDYSVHSSHIYDLKNKAKNFT